MAVISFERDAKGTWNGAGWAFRQVLRDLAPYAHDDSEFQRAMNEAANLGSFIVYLRDITLKDRITLAILRMCNEILKGATPSSIAQHHSDQETQELYRKELELLLLAAQNSTYVRNTGPHPDD